MIRPMRNLIEGLELVKEYKEKHVKPYVVITEPTYIMKEVCRELNLQEGDFWWIEEYSRLTLKEILIKIEYNPNNTYIVV